MNWVFLIAIFVGAAIVGVSRSPRDPRDSRSRERGE